MCRMPPLGEIERSLKAQFLKQRRPSSMQKRQIHIDIPEHQVDMDMDGVKILAWFEQGA